MTRIVLFLSVLVLMVPAPVLAATYNWVGLDSDWDIKTNWDPNSNFPGLNDQAIIANGHEAAVTHIDGIHQLEVGPGSALKIGYSTPGIAAFWFQHATKADDVLNNGTIRVGGPGYTGNMSCWSDTVTLHGSGNLVLGGHYPDDSLNNAGNGGKFINTAGHTIRGGGQIQALGVNQGQVIADNGGLYIQCPMDNTGGTMSASGAGNVLLIYGGGNVTGGQINPQDGGKITLTGCTLADTSFGPGLVEVVKDWWSWNVYFQNMITLVPGTTLNIAAGHGESEWNGINFGPDNGNATLVNNGAIIMNGGYCALRAGKMHNHK